MRQIILTRYLSRFAGLTLIGSNVSIYVSAEYNKCIMPKKGKSFLRYKQ